MRNDDTWRYGTPGNRRPRISVGQSRSRSSRNKARLASSESSGVIDRSSPNKTTWWARDSGSGLTSSRNDSRAAARGITLPRKITDSALRTGLAARRRFGPQQDEDPNQVARRNPHRSSFSRLLGNHGLWSNSRPRSLISVNCNGIQRQDQVDFPTQLLQEAPNDRTKHPGPEERSPRFVAFRALPGRSRSVV